MGKPQDPIADIQAKAPWGACAGLLTIGLAGPLSPRTAQETFAELYPFGKPPRTTIYRTIDTLAEAGLIERVTRLPDDAFLRQKKKWGGRVEEYWRLTKAGRELAEKCRAAFGALAKFGRGPRSEARSVARDLFKEPNSLMTQAPPAAEEQ